MIHREDIYVAFGVLVGTLLVTPLMLLLLLGQSSLAIRYSYGYIRSLVEMYGIAGTHSLKRGRYCSGGEWY
ncbi:MAG: hypothetical protein M8353_05150 [ANME-2 cluster archaeon]|nr:hypothetical protein [ANME-2 cluster archaeon]